MLDLENAIENFFSKLTLPGSSLLKDKNILASVCVLVAVYAYLFTVALSYQSTRVHESTLIRFIPAVMKNGPDIFQWQDWIGILDMQRFEDGQPRFTRPWANLMMILNHKIRGKLWQYIPPHPTLSPILLFPLFFTPLFLFLVLRGWGLALHWRLLVVAFYLASFGHLPALTETFRPGKMMVNFVLFLTVYLAQQLQQQKIRAWFFYATVFISLFWDETTLLLLPILVVMRMSNDRSKWKKIIAFFGLILLSYFLMVNYILPAIAQGQGFLAKETTEYHHLSEAKNNLKNLPQHYLSILKITLSDLVGIDFVHVPIQAHLKALFFANFLGLIIFIGFKVFKLKENLHF